MANVTVRRHLSEAEMRGAVGIVEQGETHCQAGDVFDMHHTVITRAWSRFQRYGTPVRRHGGGRERATSAAQDKLLVIRARRNRFSKTSQLQIDLQNASGVNISTQTIRSMLHEGGRRSRRPCIRIPLTRNHRRVRYEWAMDHVRESWRLEACPFYRRISICLDFTDRHARMWRRPGERLHADNIAEHDRYGGGSVMVWGGISWDGRTDLCVLHCGTLTTQRYRDDILDVHVRSYAGAIGDPFILMNDNARPLTAHAIQEYLEREGIERLDWPARSPDLNPIEHIWNSLHTEYQLVKSNQEVFKSLVPCLFKNGTI